MTKFLASILLFLLLFEGCKTQTSYEPTQGMEVDGDVIMLNENVGRVNNLAFYEHVFRDEKQRPKVLLFCSWDSPPLDFSGIYLFSDAEPNNLGKNHSFPVSKLLYLGAKGELDAGDRVFIPFASLSFTERSQSPLDLLKPGQVTKRPYFAAYLANNCEPIREKAFDDLVEYAIEHKLGEVHALGKCHGRHPETSRDVDVESRSAVNSLDKAVDLYRNYKFVLAMENQFKPGYVTEKIINVLLAGAIPIYWGDTSVLEIVNPEAFVYLDKEPVHLKEKLVTITSDPAKMESLMRAEKITEHGIYLMSWHKDIVGLREKQGKKTLRAHLLESVRKLATRSKT